MFSRYNELNISKLYFSKNNYIASMYKMPICKLSSIITNAILLMQSESINIGIVD